MAKYRKKPVVIEAVQWTGNNVSEVMSFMPRGGFRNHLLDIKTLEGVMTAQPNDWIIKGVNGEFYPCKPDIFEKTYELVREEAMVTYGFAKHGCGPSE